MPVAVQTPGGKRVYFIASGDISTLRRHGNAARVTNGMLTADGLSGGRKDSVRNGSVS